MGVGFLLLYTLASLFNILHYLSKIFLNKILKIVNEVF